MPQPPYVGGYPAPGTPGQDAPSAPPYGAPAGQPYGAPAAPYRQPQDTRFAPYLQAPSRPESNALGRVALILALVAVIGASIVLAVTLAAIGAALGPQLQNVSDDAGLQFLSPVRDIVLVAEIAGWAGTALGLWALVQGIVAVAKRSGRGTGIAAIVIAAVGPGIAAGAAFVGVVAGIASSTAA
ncbi:hypothetical protein [Microbacterium rhizophilus]|uniref:hypothetical protein n=1 Tax=Microbacterium rhizophilus TaxID=3138934 RepID=UPI0031EC952F